VLLGSFSKTVAPGLRMGWMVVPDWLRQPVLIAKQAADLHSNHLSQRVLVHLLRSLDYDAHLAGIRATYEARLRAMEAAVDAGLPGVERTRPHGGMFLWLTLPIGLDARSVLTEAMARDVVFVPGDAFSASGGSERSLRISFVTVDPDRIRDGVGRLSAAIGAARSSSP
jgi:2-aminoadipate transaminase